LDRNDAGYPSRPCPRTEHEHTKLHLNIACLSLPNWLGGSVSGRVGTPATESDEGTYQDVNGR
jgi:hypothetical protein